MIRKAIALIDRITEEKEIREYFSFKNKASFKYALRKFTPTAKNTTILSLNKCAKTVVHKNRAGVVILLTDREYFTENPKKLF